MGMFGCVASNQFFFNGEYILSQQLKICLFHNVLPPFGLCFIRIILHNMAVYIKEILLCGNDKSLLDGRDCTKLTFV